MDDRTRLKARSRLVPMAHGHSPPEAQRAGRCNCKVSAEVEKVTHLFVRLTSRLRRSNAQDCLLSVWTPEAGSQSLVPGLGRETAVLVYAYGRGPDDGDQRWRANPLWAAMSAQGDTETHGFNVKGLLISKAVERR